MSDFTHALVNLAIRNAEFNTGDSEVMDTLFLMTPHLINTYQNDRSSFVQFVDADIRAYYRGHGGEGVNISGIGYAANFANEVCNYMIQQDAQMAKQATATAKPKPVVPPRPAAANKPVVPARPPVGAKPAAPRPQQQAPAAAFTPKREATFGAALNERKQSLRTKDEQKPLAPPKVQGNAIEDKKKSLLKKGEQRPLAAPPPKKVTLKDEIQGFKFKDKGPGGNIG
jgi:hypothetical protein